MPGLYDKYVNMVNNDLNGNEFREQQMFVISDYLFKLVIYNLNVLHFILHPHPLYSSLKELLFI